MFMHNGHNHSPRHEPSTSSHTFFRRPEPGLKYKGKASNIDARDYNEGNSLSNDLLEAAAEQQAMVMQARDQPPSMTNDPVLNPSSPDWTHKPDWTHIPNPSSPDWTHIPASTRNSSIEHLEGLGFRV